MDIKILGCRGSYPIADPHTLRYGGDTTCIQASSGGTVVLLDAGTGIRHHQHLEPGIRQVHLFLTHLHWDHIIGFPQWPLLQTHPQLEVHLYGLARYGDKFYAALERSMQQPLYSRSVEAIFSAFHFHELRPGSIIDLADMRVTCAMANHPYRALAYRVEDEKHGLAFVPDTSPFDRYLFEDKIIWKDTEMSPAQIADLRRRETKLQNLIAGADWLIYDAAQTEAEYAALPHWGHSSPQQAAKVALNSGARQLVLFHHAPKRTDEQVEAMLAQVQTEYPGLAITAAAGGQYLMEAVAYGD